MVAVKSFRFIFTLVASAFKGSPPLAPSLSLHLSIILRFGKFLSFSGPASNLVFVKAQLWDLTRKSAWPRGRAVVPTKRPRFSTVLPKA